MSGYIDRVSFPEGAIVHQGDVLLTIDPRPYEATLRRAEAELQTAKSRLVLAQKNFARAADLLASHAISQEEADIRQSNLRQAEAAVDEAEAVVDAARLDVEFTHIMAPVSGRVGRKLVTEGNLITGGVGGRTDASNSAEIYSAATDSWQTAAPLATGRAGHTATDAGGGIVLLVGGDGPREPVERYDAVCRRPYGCR